MAYLLKKILLDLLKFPSSENWDDIVFRFRNQEYGAYQLRKLSTKHQLSGLIIAVTSITLFFLWLFFTYDNSKPAEFQFEEMIEYKGFDANLISIEPAKKEERKEEPQKEKPVTEAEKDINKNLPPEIKDDIPQSPKETKSAETDTLARKDTAIGGKGDSSNVAGADSGVTKEVYTEGPASPYGGLTEFMKWVQQHLVIPPEAVQHNIHGTIYVHFTVDEAGNITKVTLSKGLGYGCDQAVLDVVAKAPKWKPAVRDGKAVPQRFIIPVKI